MFNDPYGWTCGRRRAFVARDTIVTLVEDDPTDPNHGPLVIFDCDSIWRLMLPESTFASLLCRCPIP